MYKVLLILQHFLAAFVIIPTADATIKWTLPSPQRGPLNNTDNSVRKTVKELDGGSPESRLEWDFTLSGETLVRVFWKRDSYDVIGTKDLFGAVDLFPGFQGQFNISRSDPATLIIYNTAAADGREFTCTVITDLRNWIDVISVVVNASTNPPWTAEPESGKETEWIIVGAVLGSALALVVAAGIVAWFVHKRRKGSKGSSDVQKFPLDVQCKMRCKQNVLIEIPDESPRQTSSLYCTGIKTRQRKCQEPVQRETTEGPSIEFIGYRIPQHEKNGGTVSVTGIYGPTTEGKGYPMNTALEMIDHPPSPSTALDQRTRSQDSSETLMVNSLHRPEIKSEYASLNPSTRGWEIPGENVVIEKVVGKSAFGQVAIATLTGLYGNPNTIQVAVKMLKGDASESEKKNLLFELELMKQLKPHPCVVKLLGCVTKSGPLVVLIESVPYGYLLNYLRKSRGLNDTFFKDPDIKLQTNLTSEQLMKFAWQIADGMSYLSSIPVIHRDLAARNVLVGEGETCKLTSFGMARKVQEEDIYEKKTRGRLPVKWTAIEALLYGKFTTKSDVWSYGVLLYEIFTIGKSPLSGEFGFGRLYQNCQGSSDCYSRWTWREKKTERRYKNDRVV